MQKLSLSTVILQNQAQNIKRQTPPNVSHIAKKVIQVGNEVLKRKGLSKENIQTVISKISQQLETEIQPYIISLQDHQNNCFNQSERISEGENHVKLAIDLLDENARRIDSFMCQVHQTRKEIQKVKCQWEETLLKEEDRKRQEEIKKERESEYRRIEEHKKREAEAHRIKEIRRIEVLESRKAKAAAEANIKVLADPIKKEESKTFKVLQLKPRFNLLDAQKLKDQQFWSDFYKNTEWKELDTEITIQNSIFKGDGVESDTFRATTKEGEELLIKIPKKESCDYEQYIESRKEQQLYACFLASCFRKALYDQKMTDFIPLFYAPPITFQIKENQKYKNRDVLYAEPLIQQAGFEFLKYTTNGSTYSIPFRHMTIFTHYTFYITQKLMILSDLQGVNNLLTDPCFHSKTKMLTSDTNGRLAGMKKVIGAQHSKCDQKVCTALGMESLVLPDKIDLMSGNTNPSKVFTICEYCCQQTQTSLEAYRTQEQISYDMDCPILCNGCAEIYRKQNTKQCECCGEEFKYLEAYYKELKLDAPKVCLKGCTIKSVDFQEESKQISQGSPIRRPINSGKQSKYIVAPIRIIEAKKFREIAHAHFRPTRMAFSDTHAYIIGNTQDGSLICRIKLKCPQKNGALWFDKLDHLSLLTDIAIYDNYVYVTDINNDRICRINLKDPQDFDLDWVTWQHGIDQPSGIAIHDGFAYICNYQNRKVIKINIDDPYQHLYYETIQNPHINIPHYPEGISIRQGFIYVACNGGIRGKIAYKFPIYSNVPTDRREIESVRYNRVVVIKEENLEQSDMILVERGSGIHNPFRSYIFCQENEKYLENPSVIGISEKDLFIRQKKSSTIFTVSRKYANDLF